MAVSPLSPDIIASASMDLSVRIWSLDPKYEKQPCMAICGGEGHKEGLLTLVSKERGTTANH
jgi:polycomb protein EED